MINKGIEIIVIIFLLTVNCLAQAGNNLEHTNSMKSQEQVEEIKMVFEGNKIFSREELLKRMNFDEYPFQSIERMSINLQYLRLFLGEQGYIKPTIGEPELLNTETGRIIKLKFSEGLKYRFGKIKVEGVSVFSSEQILNFSGMKTGEIASSKIIREGVFEKIRKEYGQLGYIQATPDLQQYFNDANNTVDFTIVIDEGKPFYIGKIIFRGNEKNPNQVLSKELLVKEGEIYNQILVDRSIDRLNKTGLFEPIVEEDVKLFSHENRTFLEIVIHVKEK